MSQAKGDGRIIALIRRGEIYRNSGCYEAAGTDFRGALAEADRNEKPVLAAVATQALGYALFLEQDYSRADQLLQKALTQVESLESPPKPTSGVERGNPPIRHDLLKEALSLSMEMKDKPRISQTSGRLGKLYETLGLWGQAYEYSEQPIATAGSFAPRSSPSVGMATGTASKRPPRPTGAIAAYRRAVYHIESIRQDIRIRYQDGRSSFRDTLAPIYLGLADMLLLEAAQERVRILRQALLRDAQNNVEAIKRSELTDYFRDPCISALRREISALSSDTAVLYPIILPDRLDLLVDIGGHLIRKTVPVGSKRLETNVFLLSSRIRNLGEVRRDRRACI